MGCALGFQGRAQLLGQGLEALVDLFDVVAELEDRLDARQVDPQVALAAQDGPDPADLGRSIALDAAITAPRAKKASRLVTDQDPNRNRESFGDLQPGGRIVQL